MLNHLLILSILTCGQQEGASKIIQRHEDALSRLHSIRATYESRRSADGGKSWKRAARISLLKSGQKERFHEIIYGGSYAGQWRDTLSHRDLAYSLTEFRMLTGLDPDHPPRFPLSGQEEPRINAAIYPPEPEGPYGRKNSLARTLLLIPATTFSLRELYDASRSRGVKKAADGEGWTFSLDAPDGGYSYIVTVSPEHNYGISRVTMRSKGDDSPGVRPWYLTSEVTEFYDYESGFSLPKSIHTSNERDAMERFEGSLTVESINAPIPDADLALRVSPGDQSK